MYGHIAQLAKKEKEGVEAAGGKADIYQYVTATATFCASQLRSNADICLQD